ncbi:MAG: glutamine synthetase III [Eubacteriales bacterium]
MTKQIPELFGSMVFSHSVMREKLPKDTYKAVVRTMSLGQQLDPDIADMVANAMKDWAIEKGATHYTHWFQPMTGNTAEKHDSFIAPVAEGRIIMDFSGKELVHGEPDASSFPNGGIRSTCEARGYTIWDTTSYAFIKDGSLYIPTAFCSYSGECLDKKTPLLRSMEALNTQALRILKLFGNDDVQRVTTTVGPEQEYFLIDKEMFLRRPDLMFCGRTLFGAKPTKGQELDDHYFGTLKPRVAAFMAELDEELWKLGILAKTKHNEVAPAQHELAPIFTTTNVATDQNQLTMELMKTVADRHGMACLLHEKPFDGVNGSGKHNNWSLSTDTGMNLLEPGKTPYDNAQFVLFLTAVVKAVDEYQDMLRMSVGSAGNDHRLGANEAPPAIISMFLGDELTAILEALESGKTYHEAEKIDMELGTVVLPHFPRDTTDRNRTSPFAFTGNKFEFRMLGSKFSISGCNIVLNTIVAEELRKFADQLEGAKDFHKDMTKLVQETLTQHKRIIFNGNNYSDEWVVEAQKRGLSNLHSCVDAFPSFVEEKALKLFESHGVFTREETISRYEIHLENYCKVIHIEASTFIDMMKKDILACSMAYQESLLLLLADKKAAGINHDLEVRVATEMSELTASLYAKNEDLEKTLEAAAKIEDSLELTQYYRNMVLEEMTALRVLIDKLESLTPKKFWTLPTYSEMLYSV